jgi:mono/diheme cytochrome c family protein
MKRHTSPIRRLWTACTVALVIAAGFGLLATALQGADAKPEPTPKPEKKTEKKAEKKKLSGAELYQTHCSRCHPERYATERTEAQWKTIMLHMRVRANLPADQAKAVQKYLQEDAGK